LLLASASRPPILNATPPTTTPTGLEYGVLCDDESNGNFTIREWYEPDDAPPSTVSPAPSLARPPGRCREVMWESTGLYGQSQVRVVDLLTGVPIATSRLDRKWFGEGLARVGDELLQLTWQGPRGFRWGARPQPGGGLAGGGGGGGGDSARTGLHVPPRGSFDTPLQDGWGAAVDWEEEEEQEDDQETRTTTTPPTKKEGSSANAAGQRRATAAPPPPPPPPARRPMVVLSDGSDRLTWVHPGNLSAARHVDVRDPFSRRPVRHLNELEVVQGQVWANVWMTDCIAVVDKTTGDVQGWVLLHGLGRALAARPGVAGTDRMDVLNGIAWDRRRRRLFVTGKLWPRLFEVRVVPLREGRQRADAARHLLPTCFGDEGGGGGF
jgi:glutamine cyclotransferase